MPSCMKDMETDTPGVTIEYVSARPDRAWSGDYSKPSPVSSYDYSRPTDFNHRLDGSRDVVGDFANIRATLDFDYHGNYNLKRQKLQDRIIQDSIGDGTAHKSPWVIFSAGAMGAGKGYTFEWMSKQGHFPLTDIVQIDPDQFRTELPEWTGYLERDPQTAGYMTQRESGYCAEIAQEAAMQQNKNVLIDGSLRDAEWYSQIFKDIRKRYPHYRIALIHIFASWDVVCRRAASRAQDIGRVVPEVELRQSFDQVPDSVEKLRPLADFSADIKNDDMPRLSAIYVGTASCENVRMDWNEIHSRFAALRDLSVSTLPQVYIGGSHIGGWSAVEKLQSNYVLASLLPIACGSSKEHGTSCVRDPGLCVWAQRVLHWFSMFANASAFLNIF